MAKSRACRYAISPGISRERSLRTSGSRQSAVSALERDETLSLLFDISRELTSILDRDELLQRIADRIKKLVNYQLFHVMLWNAIPERLESAFSKHYEENISTCLEVPLFKGITGHSAG